MIKEQLKKVVLFLFCQKQRNSYVLRCGVVRCYNIDTENDRDNTKGTNKHETVQATIQLVKPRATQNHNTTLHQNKKTKTKIKNY